ncbi:MAG TPA: carbohydrate binding domain-containing protein, partial [Chthoniobacteraceae bacterium]|nr:carbohydrate binding domain-containing protein [Chthoniobacteraceae bacterium]
AAAWNVGAQPLGAEMLKETRFEKGAGGAWNLEQHGDARATATAKDGLAVTIDNTDGVDWHIQLTQGHVALSKSQSYTLTFSARADSPLRMVVCASQAHSPWASLWMENVKLGPEMKEYRLAFRPGADEENARICFSDLGANKTGVLFKNASLRPGGVSGLQAAEQWGSVPPFKKPDLGMRTKAAQDDWMAFLFDTESHYWTGMRQYLKEDLKAHSLIVGTSAPFSPGVIQSAMDIVDGHAYWQHPQFPGKPWDPGNWKIKNVPMAGDPAGGTLASLAGYRVAGKPYICTEYNEPAPNVHASEAFLLLGAYASLQDWDGLFVFAYSHSNENWDARKIVSFFNIDQNPGKLVTLPAVETMFLRGDIAMARRLLDFPVTREDAMNACLQSGVWWSLQRFGMKDMTPLISRVAQDPITGAQPVQPGDTAVARSDTGELTWDTKQRRVLIDSPRNKAVIGSICGPVKLGDITIDPMPDTLGWSAITATEIKPRDWLITATGYEENTGMKWTGPAMESVGRDWGTAPSRVEGIAARITVPWGGVKAFALDGRGQPGKQIPVTESEGKTTVEIGPAYQTLWYEIRD